MKKNYSLLFMSFLFLLFFSCSDFNISENAFIKISIPEVNSRSVSSNQSMKFLLTVTQKNSNEKITAEGKSGETILVELESGIYVLNLKAYAKNDTEFKTVLYEGSEADVQVEANKTTDVSIKLHRQLFTITFKDGEKVISVVDVNRNSKVTPLETPVREGYTFDGWYNGETLYDFESPVKSDLTLTAKWNEIKKDTDEIDEKTDEPEKEPEEKTDDLEEPEESENKENTEESKDQTPTPVISFNLNGGEGPKPNFKCEFGKSYYFGIEPSEFNINTPDKKWLNSYRLPSKAGYKFAGWYLDNETFEQSMNNMANAVAITEAVTVYAKWVEDNTQKHQISFNVDGNIIDTVETESAWVYMEKYHDTIQICTVGEYGDIGNMSVPVKENYVFDGWYLDSDCTKSVTDYYYATFIDKDISVYAKWAEPCIISFQTNCESTIEPIIVPKGIAIGFGTNKNNFYVYSKNTREGYTEQNSLILPIKDGKVFGGWYSDSDCQNSMMTYTGYTTITENITVYGKWIDPCYVSFNVNGGDPESEPEKLAVSPGERIHFIIIHDEFSISSNKSSSYIRRQSPTKEGWLLGGWYTDDETKVYDYWENALTVNEDITVNALWVEPCEITFDSKGGSEVEPLIVPKGVTLSFINDLNSIFLMIDHDRSDASTWFGNYSSLPRKEGYTFDGWWYLDENGKEHSCGDNIDFDIMKSRRRITINGPVTLYAKWK